MYGGSLIGEGCGINDGRTAVGVAESIDLGISSLSANPGGKVVDGKSVRGEKA